MIIDTSESKITLTPTQLADVAMSTIRATLGHVKYQYLSGPITGGRKFLDWYSTTGRSLSEADYRTAKETAVVLPNIADVKAAAKSEREGGRDTIEPASFEASFPQWGQREFLDFWESVIEQHAESVRFMDGWAYSSGCAFEYACAIRCGLPTYDMEGQKLAPERALQELDTALADIWGRLSEHLGRNAPIAELHDKILAQRGKIKELAAI